jgi:hypothetical protein
MSCASVPETRNGVISNVVSDGETTMIKTNDTERTHELTESDLDTVSAGLGMSHGIMNRINELLSFKPVSNAS